MNFLDFLHSDHVVELLMLVPFTLLIGFMVYNLFEMVEKLSNNKEDGAKGVMEPLTNLSIKLDQNQFN